VRVWPSRARRRDPAPPLIVPRTPAERLRLTRAETHAFVAAALESAASRFADVIAHVSSTERRIGNRSSVVMCDASSRQGIRA